MQVQQHVEQMQFVKEQVINHGVHAHHNGLEIRKSNVARLTALLMPIAVNHRSARITNATLVADQILVVQMIRAALACSALILACLAVFVERTLIVHHETINQSAHVTHHYKEIHLFVVLLHQRMF